MHSLFNLNRLCLLAGLEGAHISRGQKRRAIALDRKLNTCNRRARRNAAEVLGWLETHAWFLDNPKFFEID
jgi:hypothetical protein